MCQYLEDIDKPPFSIQPGQFSDRVALPGPIPAKISPNREIKTRNYVHRPLLWERSCRSTQIQNGIALFR